MTRARFLTCLVILAAVAGSAVAESYWEMGVPGEPLLAADAQSLALGGASEANWWLKDGLSDNPAALAALDGVTFATAFQLRRARREFPDLDWDETRLDFSAFQLNLTLPHRLKLGLGYRMDFRSRGGFTMPMSGPDGDSDLAYELEYRQRGATKHFPVVMAMSLGENLRLGAGCNVIMGSLSSEWIYDFDNAYVPGAPDSGYHDQKARRRADWYGLAPVIGAQFRFPGRLSASVRYEAGTELSGSSLYEIAGRESNDETELAGQYPSRLALGVALAGPGSSVFSLQWNREPWSEYTDPLADLELEDVDNYAVGAEWIWKREPRPGRRILEVPFRAGARVGLWPRRDPLTSSIIRETIIALGTGLVLEDGVGSFDLALFYQRLNDEDDAGEDRIGVAISLRSTDFWKRRLLPY